MRHHFISDDMPTGHSGGLVYEDDAVCVSYVQGNTYNTGHIKAVTVRLKASGITVDGGLRLRNVLEPLVRVSATRSIVIAALKEVAGQLVGDPERLPQMLEIAAKAGAQAERKRVQLDIRKALGL